MDNILQTINSELMVDNVDLEELTNEIIDWKNCLFKYKFALEEVNTKLKILNEEFQYIHGHNPIEHIKSRIKHPKSVIKKLIRKNLDVTVDNVQKHIHDIAGVRITCSFVSDIYDIFHILERRQDLQLVEVKDYIKNPKPNGYQSMHLIVKVPVHLKYGVENVDVEIQIRTIAMDFWASLEHKIYYKFEQAIPDHLLAELKEAADAAHKLDLKMKKIKDRVDIFQTIGQKTNIDFI